MDFAKIQVQLCGVVIRVVASPLLCLNVKRALLKKWILQDPLGALPNATKVKGALPIFQRPKTNNLKRN